MNNHDNAEPVDDDPDVLLAVDPDDYARTKKLEAIHETKRRVREVRQDAPTGRSIGGIGMDNYDKYERQLARAVATYGTELEPLILDAWNQGTLDDDDLTTPAGTTKVITFTRLDGHVPADGYDWDDLGSDDFETTTPTAARSMATYRQLNAIMRKLGHGIDLEADDADDWEV